MLLLGRPDVLSLARAGQALATGPDLDEPDLSRLLRGATTAVRARVVRHVLAAHPADDALVRTWAEAPGRAAGARRSLAHRALTAGHRVEQRPDAAATAHRTGDDAAYAGVVETLAGSDAEMARFFAVRGLGLRFEQRPASDLALVMIALGVLDDDPSALVRGAAALALARMGGQLTLTRLIQAIDRAATENEALQITLALVRNSPHHSWVESLADRLADDGHLAWDLLPLQEDVVSVCRASAAEGAGDLADAVEWLGSLR